MLDAGGHELQGEKKAVVVGRKVFSKNFVVPICGGSTQFSDLVPREQVAVCVLRVIS